MGKVRTVPIQKVENHHQVLYIVDYIDVSYLGANGINIYLMSRSDGRPMFAQVAQVVAAENDYQKIDQKIVEDAMQRYYPHEPELLLQFGMSYSNITWGYPPWLLRWTQML